ncbi:MAG TPA: zinc ribbon domain-containing protein [Planctomycetota bacterium]|nr:zinc ribbon domain-containing protein [Planctomycetota bacterium]
MPIKFQCECGKMLTAPDGTEGRRARCSACQRVVTIPSALQFDDGEATTPPPAAAGGEACPSCGRPLAPEAALCVQCGFDRRTGRQVGFSRRPRTEGRRRITVQFPVVKVAVAAGVVALLVAGWFFVAAPLLGKMRVTNAVGYVINGDLKRAVTAFEELQPKVSAADRERVDLWLRQLPLEIEKNAGKTLDQGSEVKSDTVLMDLGKPIVMSGAVVVKMRVTNRTMAPLTVRNDYFYLRGLSDIVLVATHDDNSLDGVVVKPGETREGKVVFRKVPVHPVHKGKASGAFDSAGATYFYIMYNDGANYVKRMLPF